MRMPEENAFWEFFIKFLIFVGAKSLIYYLYENLKSPFFIIKSFLSDKFHPGHRLSLKERYGNWAVITGSTDGIGKEYAKELARNGLHIVLISRSESKLIETAKEIENFGVKTKWIVADFSEGPSIYEHIKKELEGLRIGILVNNVGQMYEYPQKFENVPDKKIWDIVALNVGATVMMTKIIIEYMQKGGRGAIVNISSICQNNPGPYYAVYAASKVFVKYFTLAMQYELAPSNISVQLLSPAFIATNLTKFSDYLSQDGLIVANVKSYVQSAVSTLGKSGETAGSISHGLQFAFCALAPERIRTFISGLLAKYTSKNYLRKKAIKD